MRLERLALDQCDWPAMDSLPDRVVFQTREWLSFLEATQGGEPIVAALRHDGATVGYFTGMIVRRMGLRILGSPFRGWTTMYMGFNLIEDVPRAAVADALVEFAFRRLRCAHLEVRDHVLVPGDLQALGFEPRSFGTYLVDLDRSEEEVWASFTSSCRGHIRRAAKAGVSIEEAHDVGFADEYYAQLEEVFGRQGLVPGFDLQRVRALIRHLHPTGHLLLLRARDREGACIATGIFPAMNRTMYFWGGASWRSQPGLSPNEAIMWHAVRYWKSRGIRQLDLGGRGDYKRKYGGSLVSVPSCSRSRFWPLDELRNAAERAFVARQRLTGRIRQLRATSAKTSRSKVS